MTWTSSRATTRGRRNPVRAYEPNGGERDIPAGPRYPFEQSVLTELGGKTAPGTPLGERGSLIGFVLARQLEDRVSHLFVLDRRNMRPYGLLREDLEEELKLGRSRSEPTTRRIAPRSPASAPPARSRRRRSWRSSTATSRG